MIPVLLVPPTKPKTTMKDLSELAELVAIVKNKQMEMALQAFGDALPMTPSMAIHYLVVFTSSADIATSMVGYACAEGHLQLWRDGRALTADDIADGEPEVGDQIHLGPTWVPTMDTFGVSIIVASRDKRGVADTLS